MAYHNSLFRIRTIVLLTCLFLLNQCEKPTPITENNLLSEDSFKNPPIENRPLSLSAWLNGYVDTTKMVYELEQMKEKGMRGAFIWDVGAISDPEKMVPAGPAFLEDESLGYINLALKTGKRLGLDLGLFASSSWSRCLICERTVRTTNQLPPSANRVPSISTVKVNLGRGKLASRGQGSAELIHSRIWNRSTTCAPTSMLPIGAS